MTPPQRQKTHWIGDRVQVTLGAVLGEGRQGVVREVVSEPYLAAKVYSPELRAPEKVAVHLKVDARDWLDEDRCPRLAWPVAELHDEHGVAGLMMIRFTEDWCVLESILSSKERAESELSMSWRDLVAVAISLAELVDLVHEKGWIVGDLSSKNVLVGTYCRAALVDCDDMIPVDASESGRSPMITPEYGSWELLNQRWSTGFTFETDAWSLAILINQLLQDGVHPFSGPGKGHRTPDGLRQNIKDGLNRYRLRERFSQNGTELSWPPLEVLSPDVCRLFVECFVAGHKAPKRRPTPKKWAEELRAIRFRDCDTVEGHVFSNHLNTCPWCDRLREDPGALPDLRVNPRPGGVR